MGKRDREKTILLWMDRIERSSLSVSEFFSRRDVPFTRAQYYRYRKRVRERGEKALLDARGGGNHRRMHAAAEGFLRGYATANPQVDLSGLREVLRKQFSIELTNSGMSRCMKRLGCSLGGRRQDKKASEYHTPFGGFELVVGLACRLGWPTDVASVIRARVEFSKGKQGRLRGVKIDRRGRDRKGRFGAEYNRRRDVRTNRFASVEDKREQKRLDGMSVAKADSQTLARKCLAALALPVVTHNGQVRSVDAPMGNALKHICGFNYKQSTLTKFMAELKYLGVADDLLQHQVAFWQERWRKHSSGPLQVPVLCYYVDGNTKALWSSKRVKKNKVTMLGRVMGCLEQVFVHDSYGRPVYFETYSGHAPVGEYVLSLFEKIEQSLQEPGGRLSVNRAIVMDGAGNSVRTLRAFAGQNRYHYITSLDDNQWDTRKLRRVGRPQRYRYGEATLRDCEIELEDSRREHKGYLVVSRAIEIQWDHGKRTVLLTSLNAELVVASEVVKSYFDRWPYQELAFRDMKAVACLHRVAGYGKQRQTDADVLKRQKELAKNTKQLREQLASPLVEIAKMERQLASLVKRQRPLRGRSRIVNGKRILSKADQELLLDTEKRIRSCNRTIKSIEKQHEKAFQRLRKAEKEWFRLQGKEMVYKADVELDQIMTCFRVGLVNLYAYLALELFGASAIAMRRLVQSVLLLPATIRETHEYKEVRLEYNAKEPEIMTKLRSGIERVNTLGFKTLDGRRIVFDLIGAAV
jgi:transposase